MQFDEELDTLGLLCPLPVLKAAKRMRGLGSGAVLKLVADDPAAEIDVPHFCNEQGYDLLSSHNESGQQTYIIRKP